MEGYLYILGASPHPDRVECSVPYRIDDQEIFFGPCLKKLRRKLARELLARDDIATPAAPIYVFGFNGMNLEQTRKIVWAGRIKQVMTFARAWEELKSPRYGVMRGDPLSPLHVRPILEDGRLVGYEHASGLHGKEKWIEDLCEPLAPDRPWRFTVSPDRLAVRVHDGVTAQEAFPRDACFLIENVFSAKGRGIEIDDEVLAVLRERQPGRKITPLAVFGYQSDDDRKQVEGRQGSYLVLRENLVIRLISVVRRRSIELADDNQKAGPVTVTPRGCGCGANECAEVLPDDGY